MLFALIFLHLANFVTSVGNEEYEGEEEEASDKDVTRDQLPKGETENSLWAPVAWFVQWGVEVRFPDCVEPVIAEREPDGEE